MALIFRTCETFPAHNSASFPQNHTQNTSKCVSALAHSLFTTTDRESEWCPSPPLILSKPLLILSKPLLILSKLTVNHPLNLSNASGTEQMEAYYNEQAWTMQHVCIDMRHTDYMCPEIVASHSHIYLLGLLQLLPPLTTAVILGRHV